LEPTLAAFCEISLKGAALRSGALFNFDGSGLAKTRVGFRPTNPKISPENAKTRDYDVLQPTEFARFLPVRRILEDT
jgi:hypothetical protein